MIIFVHFSAKARQYCFLFFFSAHDSHINKTSWTKIRTRCKAIVAGAWLSWHHTMMPQLLLERCIVREAAIWLLSAADSCSRATDPTLETQEDRWTLSTGKPHTRAHTHTDIMEIQVTAQPKLKNYNALTTAAGPCSRHKPAWSQ